MEEATNVVLNENCSIVMLNKLPMKMGDPGSLTLPCQFGNLATSHALADSGASVNLMPYSFYSKLNIPEPTPIHMAIHLANKMVTFPRVLDIEEDNQVPIILGKPFFSTARALVDIRESKLTIRAGEDAITFGVDKAMKHSKITDDMVFSVDTFDAFTDK
ncbi:uncharacterized protein LOC128133420 [Lactuca sativa]|uniref:uncharacterized protein LOC128133420 n=1 Tax=Lactuca sativa TaxID=4236 RepID=UPI0022B02B08|nr:uncharacterized protein LOC128133420 [Lactuca sativa]